MKVCQCVSIRGNDDPRPAAIPVGGKDRDRGFDGFGDGFDALLFGFANGIGDLPIRNTRHHQRQHSEHGHCSCLNHLVHFMSLALQRFR